MNENINSIPDIKVSVKQTFGIDVDLEVDAFSKKNDFVPDIDKNYKFDKDTTIAILSGFSFKDFTTSPTISCLVAESGMQYLPPSRPPVLDQ